MRWGFRVVLLVPVGVEGAADDVSTAPRHGVVFGVFSSAVVRGIDDGAAGDRLVALAPALFGGTGGGAPGHGVVVVATGAADLTILGSYRSGIVPRTSKEKS